MASVGDNVEKSLRSFEFSIFHQHVFELAQNVPDLERFKHPYIEHRSILRGVSGGR